MKETMEIAEKIVSLTGYGQALHVNDIFPDLEELVSLAITADRKELTEKVAKLKEEALVEWALADETENDTVRHLFEGMLEAYDKFISLLKTK